MACKDVMVLNVLLGHAQDDCVKPTWEVEALL